MPDGWQLAEWQQRGKRWRIEVMMLKSSQSKHFCRCRYVLTTNFPHLLFILKKMFHIIISTIIEINFYFILKHPVSQPVINPATLDIQVEEYVAPRFLRKMKSRVC